MSHTVTNLDSPEDLKRADIHGLTQVYLDFPVYAKEALNLAEGLEIPKEVQVGNEVVHFSTPKRVVLVGMGGSAICGDLLRGWLLDRVSIPVEVCMDYRLPSYVGGETLVFAVSYSGNTEETLSAFVDAVRRGCMVVSISSGGLLTKFSKKLGFPHVQIPEGYAPRVALPYLFFPIPKILTKLGVKLDFMEGEVLEAIKVLEELREECRPETPIDGNPAKRLAMELHGFIPVVYGFRWLSPVARRMKGQFNENSKVPSFHGSLPAINHDEIVGWNSKNELTRGFKLVLLRDRAEPPEIRNRIELTKRLASGRVGGVVEVWGRGVGRLARILSLTYIGDLASLYLAFLRGVDPLPIPAVTTIKEEMAKRLHTHQKLEEEVERLSRLTPNNR